MYGWDELVLTHDAPPAIDPGCSKTLKEPLMWGDNAYDFVCSVCGQGTEHLRQHVKVSALSCQNSMLYTL